jgi:hypothetical protein
MSYGGHPSGSYEWTGEEWTTWGGGPCRKTNAKCYIKQDYINGLASASENQKNSLISQKGADVLTLDPVPNVNCCQDIKFQNISANKISYDNINQTCSAPPSTPAPVIKPASTPVVKPLVTPVVKPSATPSKPVVPTTNTATWTTQSKTVVALIIIVIIIVIISSSSLLLLMSSKDSTNV